MRRFRPAAHAWTLYASCASLICFDALAVRSMVHDALVPLIVLFSGGAIALRLSQSYGPLAYLGFSSAFTIFAPFILSWSMDARVGPVPALLGGLVLFGPLYLLARLRKPLRNAAEVAMSCLAVALASAMSLVVVVAILFFTGSLGM